MAFFSSIAFVRRRGFEAFVSLLFYYCCCCSVARGVWQLSTEVWKYVKLLILFYNLRQGQFKQSARTVVYSGHLVWVLYMCQGTGTKCINWTTVYFHLESVLLHCVTHRHYARTRAVRTYVRTHTHTNEWNTIVSPTNFTVFRCYMTYIVSMLRKIHQTNILSTCVPSLECKSLFKYC